MLNDTGDNAVTEYAKTIIEFTQLQQSDRHQIVAETLRIVREAEDKGPEKWQLFGIITEQFEALNAELDDLQHKPRRRGRKPRSA